MTATGGWRSAISLQDETTPLTLGQAAARYLGSLPLGQREVAAAEINKFVRKAGADRPLSSITRLEVDNFQQSLIDAGFEAPGRVEPVKLFLADVKARKWTTANLGAGLRARRRGGSAHARRVEAQVIELTREGLQQIQNELSHLETDVAPAVQADLAAAYQDHDFRENAPYDEAKRRMGEVKGRIDSLRAQIKASRVVERQLSTERAGLGSRVVLRDMTYDDELIYTLVGPGEVNAREGRISIQSPVGSATKDREVGDEFFVDIPTGRVKYRLERIERS